MTLGAVPRFHSVVMRVSPELQRWSTPASENKLLSTLLESFGVPAPCHDAPQGDRAGRVNVPPGAKPPGQEQVVS